MVRVAHEAARQALLDRVDARGLAALYDAVEDAVRESKLAVAARIALEANRVSSVASDVDWLAAVEACIGCDLAHGTSPSAAERVHNSVMYEAASVAS